MFFENINTVRMGWMINMRLKKNVSKILKRNNQNKGTTILEVVTAFTVIAIIFVSLFHIIQFSSNLITSAASKKKAEESAESAIYQNNAPEETSLKLVSESSKTDYITLANGRMYISKGTADDQSVELYDIRYVK